MVFAEILFKLVEVTKLYFFNYCLYLKKKVFLDKICIFIDSFRNKYVSSSKHFEHINLPGEKYIISLNR